jgi:uncharacterized protein YebE (UPF0316 family)
MVMPAFFDSTLYIWAILPLLIFCARIMDVSLDTLRIIFINRHLKTFAAFIGFFEVMIWLLAIRQVFQNLGNPLCFIAYAAGFAAGNYVGVCIENRLSIGKVIIRVITKTDADELVNFLKTAGYGITAIPAIGVTGPVKVLFSIVERQHIDHIVKIIREFNPQAFYSIEDVRFVSEAVTPFRLPTMPRWHPGNGRKKRLKVDGISTGT